MARRRGLWAWCRLVVVVQGSFFGFGGGEKEEPASARRHSFAHLSDEQLEARIAKLEESMRGSEASAMAPSRLRLLADLKEDFEHRASSLAPGDAAPSLGGVAIWSLGRCATGTFADSVKESGGLVRRLERAEQQLRDRERQEHADPPRRTHRDRGGPASNVLRHQVARGAA